MNRKLKVMVQCASIVIVSSVALIPALAEAAALPKNSVGTAQIKKDAVTTSKIKNSAVTAAKIKVGAVTAAKLSAGAKPSGVVQSLGTALTNIATGITEVARVTITIPAAGQVLVTCDVSWINMYHITGTQTAYSIAATKTLNGAPPAAAGTGMIRAAASEPTAYNLADGAFRSEVLFSETVAGAHTYYCNTEHVSGTDTFTAAGAPYARAIYFSAAY